ncbi:MAG: tautomerase family protein [Desulfuromonadales bacterium]|nr:tautomerase family protein [Desulfuromonadales bacterium]
MPVITIEMMPQECAKKAEIAKVFTNELSRITGVPKEPITVLFHDLSPEHCAAGGEMLSEKFKKKPAKKPIKKPAKKTTKKP